MFRRWLVAVSIAFVLTLTAAVLAQVAFGEALAASMSHIAACDDLFRANALAEAAMCYQNIPPGVNAVVPNVTGWAAVAVLVALVGSILGRFVTNGTWLK